MKSKPKQERKRMNIEDEMIQLGELQHVGMALLQFVRSLERGNFVKSSKTWLYDPYRFVGFEIRLQKKKLNVLVRDKVFDLISDEHRKVLPCYRGGNWSARLEITSPRQLHAACEYIVISRQARRHTRAYWLTPSVRTAVSK